MSKRSASEGNEATESLDFRHQKLKSDSSGQLISEQGTKTEKKEAAALDRFASANNSWSHRVFSAEGKVDTGLLHSDAGHGYRHVLRCAKTHPEILKEVSSDTTSDDEDAVEDQSDPSLLTPARDLTDEGIEELLTAGVVKDLQDPNADFLCNPGPVMQVVAARQVDPTNSFGHDRSVRPFQFTLADGDHCTIPGKVSVRITNKAEGVRDGYVIQITRGHRLDADLYGNGRSQPALGIVGFDVVGRGNIVGSPRVHQSRPTEEVAAAANNHESATHDLDGWSFDQDEPPPIPAPCTAPCRSCSIAGVNFFRRCICEEQPAGDKDLEDVKKVYFAATEDVDLMTAAHKRNMLYWLYATDVYGWRGWQNRMELPPCLVFAIRKLHPNPKGTPYVEFKMADEE